MKKGGGRRKGSSFELTLAKQISNAIGVEYGSAIRRTPNSGALTTRADLYIAPKYFDKFPFFLEAKCRENWNFHQYFSTTKEWEPISWYKDAIEKSKIDPHYPESVIPILVFAQNRKVPLLMIRDDYYCQYADSRYFTKINKIISIDGTEGETYFVFLWSDFLSTL